MKKYLLLLIIVFQSVSSFSFTLNTSTAARFSKSSVKLYVTSNTDCTAAGMTKEELLSIAMDGAKDFWNTVPTSAMRIEEGGIYATDDNLYQTGELCATDVDNSCDNTTAIPLSSDIILACNSNPTNFSASNILAISGPNNISGTKITGSVILINNAEGSSFALLSYHEKRSALAHEIGHALGLGHSNKNEALMFDENATIMNRLAQDDIDGISYLYPNKLDGCGSFFGLMNLDDDTQFIPPNFLKSLGYGLLLFFFLWFTVKVLLYIQRALDITKIVEYFIRICKSLKHQQ